MGRRNGPTAAKTNLVDRNAGPRGSARVNIAGKGNAKAETWKAAEEIGTGNGLIESETRDRKETPGGKPERVSTKEVSVP